MNMQEQIVEIFFGKDGDSKHYVGDGWREPEDDRRWSVGGGAGLVIPGFSLTDKFYIVVHMSAFVVPGKLDRQMVRVLLDERYVCEWVIGSSDFTTKVIEVPDSKHTGRDSLDIFFETPDANSPANFEMSADKDQLGICVLSVTVVSNSFLEKFSGSLDVTRVGSFREYQNIRTTNMIQRNRRMVYESVLAFQNKKYVSWSFSGFCQVCNRKTNFTVELNSCDTPYNYREQCICGHCGLKNRQRFLTSLLFNEVIEKRNHPQIYLYEQLGTLFNFLSTKIDGDRFCGSEYLGPGYKPGECVDGIRHEDAMNLCFTDDFFDCVISCDVFEHVPDIAKAISEAFRILKKGGKLIFSVPFNYAEFLSKRKATLVGDTIEFLAPPEYHANPLDPNGSLVFYDFGWDIIDVCKNAGFVDAYSLNYWGADAGYLGADNLFVFVAKK